MNFFLIFVILRTVFGHLSDTLTQDYVVETKMKMITDIFRFNLNSKGWTNFISVGRLPDEFFKEAQDLKFTFIVMNGEDDTYDIEDSIQYRPNAVLIDCINIDDFEKKFNTLRNSPSWHPHAHMIIYYHEIIGGEDIGKLFFILWYYQCCNTILVQFNDAEKQLMVTNYSPYVNVNYQLDHQYGCWTRQKVVFPIANFQGFLCIEGCHNVTTESILRTNNLGTCIGYATHILNYNDSKALQSISFFEDKGKNLHGYPLSAYAREVLPFIKIDENKDGTYTLGERDGLMYTEMANAMNFVIDLTPSLETLKMPFNFESSVEQIYSLARRRVDLILMPVYLFDLVIVEVDMTVPFKDSGLCFMSHLADYETILFDLKLLQSNYGILLKFLFCFFGTWFTFIVFNAAENNTVSVNQVGKDLSNAIRNILSISLYKPPKKQNFRIFLTISIWSFFVMNFATQAAIISFFSAYKRGKNVDTFDDIVEKGYKIEGMVSPDAMLPETEEKYRIINSRLVHISDLFSCVTQIRNDSQKFCLVDCSVGRYLERNQLNNKGEPYLHITKDQVHNHYLVMLLHKNSALTDQFNKYMMKFIEAGLVDKWEAYRYKDIKHEVPIKALNTEDLSGIFICYGLLTTIAIAVFFLEMIIHLIKIITLKLRRIY